jgi:two-component system chemotaxis response regulator CheB
MEHQIEPFRNIIVIGASAGGFQAISEVISVLPGNIDAAVFIIIHISDKSNAEHIAQYCQKSTSLTCSVPADGSKIQRGHLYVAPANYHMMLKDNSITINQGARENKYRPSIDVLFRSAAAHFGSRVISLILTGMLDDGTSGMSAIKRSGGICIVQDPSEAEFPDMPQSVINHLKVDYCLPLKEIGLKLNDILSLPLPPEKEIPEEIKIESEISENMVTPMSKLSEIADQSVFTCPECGGGLWGRKE